MRRKRRQARRVFNKKGLRRKPNLTTLALNFEKEEKWMEVVADPRRFRKEEDEIIL